MKRTSLLISAVLLSVIAVVQTATAQKVTLYMADNQTYECDIARLDSIVFSEAQTIIPAEEIVVTVDAYGNADGGHLFSRIDETTFLIDGLKYKYVNGDLTVTGYDPVFFSGVAKIISKLIYNGRSMNVVGIDNKAFSECSSLTSVTIGSGVTSIGDYAFSSCTGLTSVTIPESVTSIGYYAFSGCSSLTSVTIPKSVTSIGNSAFYGCFFKTDFFVNNSSLTSDNNWGATLYDEERSDGLIIINNIVVRCRPWAVSITIPNNVTSIGSGAFRNCTSLTSITIPESVTSIGSNAFSGCSSLTSITIPESVTGIGGSAFSGCSSLTDVYCYAENVPSTGSYAFDGFPISRATLHVPAGSVDAYKARSPWKNFGSIVAIE